MKFSKANNEEPLIIASDDGKEYTARFSKGNVKEFLQIEARVVAEVKAAEANGETFDLVTKREFEDSCILAVFDNKEIVAGLLEELEPAVISLLWTHVASRCVASTPELIMKGREIIAEREKGSIPEPEPAAKDEDAEKNVGQSSGAVSDSQTTGN